MLKKLNSLWGVVGVLLCLGFPLVWNTFSPGLSQEETYVALTEFDWSRAVGEDVSVQQGRLVDQGTFTLLLIHDERITVEFDVPKDGIYSLYGITSHDVSRPLDLSINEELVSTLAFWRRTGSVDRDFRRERIATAVHLNQGTNIVKLNGTELFGRPLLFVLQEQLPLTLARYVLLFAAAMLVFALVLALPLRNPKKGSTKVAVLVTVSFLVLVGAPTACWVLYGSDLTDLGVKYLELSTNLEALESYLASDEHQNRTDTQTSIALLGDSSHLLYLEGDDQMLPTFRRKVPEPLRADLQIYGMASGALSAFDFYFILNRLVSEKPDLIVIPANQRWFADERIYGSDVFDFYELEGLVKFSEYPRLLPITVGDRPFRLLPALFYKLDTVLAGGHPLRFARGVRKYYSESERLVENAIRKRLPPAFEKSPFMFGSDDVHKYGQWNDAIEPDHEYFQMFHLINRLAQEHGISILYYSSGQNVESNLEKGLDMKLQENTDVIRRTITEGSHIYFLDIAKENPPEMFSDDHGHLTPAGADLVATKLMNASLQILGLSPEGEAVPDLVQGPLD